MRVFSLLLAFVLADGTAMAQQSQPIHASMEKTAAAAAAAQQRAEGGRGTWFWPGVALGVAGVTTAVLGLTVYRVEDSSSGNAPPSAFQTCVAQKTDPIYATNNCDALKGKNRRLLWSGAAIGALGAVMIIGSAETSATVEPGAIRLLHRVRF
jgi:hypothetical protein